MNRRARRPSFNHDELPMLLDALRDARMWTLKYGSAHDFHSDARPICEAVTKSIDHLGEELTGDPEYFWRKVATGN